MSDLATPPSGAALRRLASRVSLLVAVTLVIVKIGAWLATGSVALLASAADALVDVAASLVTFYWVRFAERPPDLHHRFGHGKGEAVAAFTEAALLIGAAAILAFQSVERLIFPEPITAVDVGLWVTVGSLLAAIGLVAMETWVMRHTASTAIAANRANFLTDIAANAAVLAALAVVRTTGWLRADPAFALAISGYMLFNASRIASAALAQLLDRELPQADRDRIKAAVLDCDSVRATARFANALRRRPHLRRVACGGGRRAERRSRPRSQPGGGGGDPGGAARRRRGDGAHRAGRRPR